MIASCPKINESDIKDAISEITNESTAKLVGLIAHIVYWTVYGLINDMPLDSYHMK